MSNSRRTDTRARGNAAETEAVEYLVEAGFSILHRNYRFDRGEIDIIAEDGDELVFVEVKARRSKRFGEPEDAVTPQKEEQMRKVAEGYCIEHRITGHPCRFDVIAISYSQGRRTVKHLKNVF